MAETLLDVLAKAGSAAVVLGAVIITHEIGHFVAAKLVGVRVERFSIGFPPKLVGVRRGETEYAIGAVPLGGYVTMTAEHPGDGPPEDDPRAFTSRPVWARAVIIAAGPAANVMLAVLIYTAAAWLRGEAVPTTRVGAVSEGGPAQAIGISVGDSILSVDGAPVGSWDQLVEAVHPRPNETITVSWLSGDSARTAVVTTTTGQIVGDNGLPKTVGLIGIGPAMTYRPAGVMGGIGIGFRGAWAVVRMVSGVLVGLFRGEVSPRALGGPLMIAQAAGQTARAGPSALLALIAFLSVNLGVVNALPIPILDGGGLVLLMVEGALRRPIPKRVQLRIQQVGLAIIAFLVVFVTWQDVSRLVK